METFSIEFRIGSTWHKVATFTADDLAAIALKAFRKAQPAVEWRLSA